jgi:hypothetical protein
LVPHIGIIRTMHREERFAARAGPMFLSVSEDRETYGLNWTDSGGRPVAHRPVHSCVVATTHPSKARPRHHDHPDVLTTAVEMPFAGFPWAELGVSPDRVELRCWLITLGDPCFCALSFDLS